MPYREPAKRESYDDIKIRWRWTMPRWVRALIAMFVGVIGLGGMSDVSSMTSWKGLCAAGSVCFALIAIAGLFYAIYVVAEAK